MPLYMTQFAYTSESWAALVDNPEDRSAPVREVVETDGLLIYEAPDDASAGAAILAAARHGHLRATKTTPLFSAEEGIEIMRRAGGTAFRPPGR